MLKIALTGGIGCGKSAAADYFAKLKAPIIDADKIVHELLKPETTTYKKIIAYFGKSFVTHQKSLNRKKLRDEIFSDTNKRIWLEDLLHPLVIKQIQKNTEKTEAPYCIMVIPLLFETKYKIDYDRALLIDCIKKNQVSRVKKRDESTIKQIDSIINRQTKRSIRLKKADDIIHNNGSLEELKKEVKKLHTYYLSLV